MFIGTIKALTLLLRHRGNTEAWGATIGLREDILTQGMKLTQGAKLLPTRHNMKTKLLPKQ